MINLARNDLVWTTALAWQQIEHQAWDGQAQEIISHWRANNLPLVVCRQRDEIFPDQISVGLPAPTQWARRRLALTINTSSIAESGAFPTLTQIASTHRNQPAEVDLDSALSELGAQAQVYGSYGWQVLTGLVYLHEDSDIDISVRVKNFDMAWQAVHQLATTQLPSRIDGEIVFPDGKAIAWRELLQLITRQTSQVMVKDRYSVRLATLEEISSFGRGVQVATPAPN
ncbi:MAG: malonate decarboxylase holo-[acyl-carrier-protein] synthase [Burkholderiales bacterium]